MTAPPATCEATARPRRPAGRPRRAAGEDGSVTLWLLGLTLLLLALGGLGLDLTRAFAHRQALAGVADAAAVAAAAKLDAADLRGGVVRLDRQVARQWAATAIAAQADADLLTAPAVITVDDTVVRVTVRGEVPLTLLRLVAPGPPLQIEVTGVATAGRGA